jgi:hypothetical protein
MTPPNVRTQTHVHKHIQPSIDELLRHAPRVCGYAGVRRVQHNQMEDRAAQDGAQRGRATLCGALRNMSKLARRARRAGARGAELLAKGGRGGTRGAAAPPAAASATVPLRHQNATALQGGQDRLQS